MEKFRAYTHYGDWAGTVAADNHGPRSEIHRHLKEKSLIHEGEHLLGLSFEHGETHGKEIEHLCVTAFLFTGLAGYENIPAALDAIRGPIPVRQIKLDLTLSEFMTLFKRFRIVLTSRALNIENREYHEAY